MKVSNINLMANSNREPLSTVALPNYQFKEQASPICIRQITILKNAPKRPVAATTKTWREDMVEQWQYQKFNNKIQRVATKKSKQEAALVALERQLLGSKHIQHKLKQITAARK